MSSHRRPARRQVRPGRVRAGDGPEVPPADDAEAIHRAEEVRHHLLERAISAQEEERRRVARELHDSIGQTLTALLVGLRTLEETGGATDPDAVHRLRQLTAEALREVGRIARGLRPSTLDDLGLVPAVRRFVEELALAGHLLIDIQADGVSRLPDEVETTLYRILQEALTNLARHARARTASVKIGVENGVVVAVVRDDGVGFDMATALRSLASHRGLGLLGMQERAELLGGSVSFESQRDHGTRVTVRLPLTAAR